MLFGVSPQSCLLKAGAVFSPSPMSCLWGSDNTLESIHGNQQPFWEKDHPHSSPSFLAAGYCCLTFCGLLAYAINNDNSCK